MIRRFYQKITDIYSQCSYDYDKNSQSTRTFYATVQNKLHWAITKHTASELIIERANSNKKNMSFLSAMFGESFRLKEKNVRYVL